MVQSWFIHALTHPFVDSLTGSGKASWKEAYLPTNWFSSNLFYSDFALIVLRQSFGNHHESASPSLQHRRSVAPHGGGREPLVPRFRANSHWWISPRQGIAADVVTRFGTSSRSLLRYGVGFGYVQTPEWILHDVDTTPGNSGSSCLTARSSDNQLVVAHVHNGNMPSYGLNYATTITVCVTLVVMCTY